MLIHISKLFSLILILLLVFENVVTLNFNFDSNNTRTTKMSSILQHFTKEVFRNKTSRLVVTKSISDNRAKYYLNELVNEYLKELSDIRIKLKNPNGSYKPDFAYFNVIFVDSFDSFRKVNPGPRTVKEDFSEYYVIILYSLNNEPEKEIQEIFDYFWKYYTVNVALLLETENNTTILLYNYFPFTKKSCKTAQMKVISTNSSLLELKSSDIFPNKFKDFYNCTLTAALWNVPPYLTLPTPGSYSKRLAGIEGYLLNVLSRVLNFQIDYIVPPNNEQRGLVKVDGTLTGAIKLLTERSADLSLGSFRCTLERSTALSPSATVHQTMQVFTVLSLHQPWSGLEIIAFPFQFHIWIVLMVLVLVLLVSPHILKSYRPNILKFIYGFSSVYFINMNIIAIILSQNVLVLPQRNFARYIFLMWILLTMILRSIYQGALYDLLKTQQTLALPDTADDLVKHGYKLIVNVATNDTFSGLPIIRDNLLKVLIMNISDDGGFPFLEANPGKRYVTGTPKDFLSYYVKTHDKNGIFHVLKETIFTQQLCIYFTKHSYLVTSFDSVLKKLQSFGLIDYWASRLLDNRFVERGNEVKAKTPLTLTQLSGIVEICMWLYFISFMVFLCEIFWFKLKPKK